ncbi:MAG: M10 family metallopeptidase C-terminal domain-containing protein, partial [Pseudomonadota bacterium]
GNDTFVYKQVDNSPNSGDRDTIADFTAGEDVIDLSALFGSGASFIGTAGFSGGGAEVRFFVGGNGNANVVVDSDGDGSADLRITLSDVSVLSEDDFVF